MIPLNFNKLGVNAYEQGDCLPDGTFSTEAPNGVVTGGPCLINGDNLFRLRADVKEVTGTFRNMTRCQGMFFGGGVSSLTAKFPKCTNFYTAFFNCKLVSVFFDAPKAQNLYGTFQGNILMTSLVINSEDITSIRSLITSCLALVNIEFLGSLDNCTNAIDFANGCTKLSNASIDHIINKLPTHTTPRDIGFNTVPMTQAQYDAFLAKGWTPTGAIIS